MIDIKDKKDCCGCWACFNACPKRCIAMEEDAEGFRYPQVNMEVCIDCGLCEKVCPIINAEAENPKPQKAFLLQHKDEQVLRESTSGGAFTAIAMWVIRRGGVVFGAAYDDNLQVVHKSVESVEDLRIFRNSKYVQSYVGDAYRETLAFLKAGRMVCFSGTPCQLEGLLKFLRKPYENLITVDLMCHSITSPKVFRMYVNLKKSEKGQGIDNVVFRDKRPYGYKYSQMSIYKEGTQVYHEGVETDVYLRSFFSDMNVRPSCYACKFKKRYRLTDFTLWDCFDVYKFSKEMDNDKGVTRILAHTERAVDILRQLSEVRLLEIDADKAVAGVREMTKSVNMNQRRKELFKELTPVNGGGNLYTLYPITLKTKVEKCVRIVLAKTGIYSMLKRIAKTFVKELKRT